MKDKHASAQGMTSLNQPVTSRRRPRVNIDPDAVGRYSEMIARFFGTGRYLMIQTVVVVVWIIINVSWVAFRFDPYPFILLNLAFSTQAAYAAPLILLAQNRFADFLLADSRERQALLRRFGSVKKMRAASVDEIASVSGIGPKLAEAIREGLARDADA